MGKGFVRGAYTCVCNEGYSYPVEINPPFQGESLEQATHAEYEAGFSCHPTDCKSPSLKNFTLEIVACLNNFSVKCLVFGSAFICYISQDKNQVIFPTIEFKRITRVIPPYLRKAYIQWNRCSQILKEILYVTNAGQSCTLNSIYKMLQ